MRISPSLFVLCAAIAITIGGPHAVAASATIIDNNAVPGRAVIKVAAYSVSPPGKWTVAVSKTGAIRYQSIDGTQQMQIGVIEMHPKAKETEDDVFRGFVDGRRQLEHDNIENKALKADAVSYADSTRGKVALWSVVDPAGSSGHLTAILASKRKPLIVSYDAAKVGESEFRAAAEQVTSSMALGDGK